MQDSDSAVEVSRPGPDDRATPNLIESEGRAFTSAQRLPIPEWPCTRVKRQQPTLTLKNNDLFLITDTLGNISGCLDDQVNTGLGLFCRDTRFLSRLELQIEGEPPILLSSTAHHGFSLSALCANPYLETSAQSESSEPSKAPGALGGVPLEGDIPAETVGIQRELALQGGLFEELTLTNYSTRPVSFELSLSFEADFADLFEIRGQVRSQTGIPLRQIRLPQNAAPSSLEPNSLESEQLAAETGELVLAYQGVDQLLMESRIQFYRRRPDRFLGYTALWKIALAPHQSEVLAYRLQPFIDAQSAAIEEFPATLAQAMATEVMEMKHWCDRVTTIHTANRSLDQTIERAEKDIYLLGQTFQKGTLREGKVLSAGIPWFSTLFGRDSIIAAQQTLILTPDTARQTLSVLAQYQGTAHNSWREEEPGKILHELRLGEMARCGEVPHTPYYGSVDATPLWLMLYADYYAWTGDRALVDQLWDNAIAAMDWIDQSCQKTGYLTYERLSAGGLRNQGWKDSGDCIVNAKGELAEGAIALCEVQGYVYAAKTRLAHLARLKQQPELAERWQQQAQQLKKRFQKDFWLPERGYLALALDGDGKPVDSITSNPGHCLSTGILSDEQNRSVAERLGAPDMFSGWGIRTLSNHSPAYNPMGYHVGSVWPHENGIIAAGLRAMGYTRQALAVAQGILQMTAQQAYQRPPELFCGFPRWQNSADETSPESSPVRYPVACLPQAWATGAIFQLLQTMVNLVPDAPNNCLRIVHPTLPESVEQISLKNLRVGQTLLNLEFERSDKATACRVVNKRGNLRVVIEA